ncbi:hypothetical protein AAF712_000098 [Marasmius tenuissimus]|uniref:Uncharacterized protein n=1 Tax=Marasmius tenuissimus TaxID=585030 RepID=A0ABR3AFM1_9AGAR
MAPHFLCCLPIRFGAFIIAVFSILIGLAVAGLAWAGVYFDSTDKEIELNNGETFKLTTRQKIVLIVYGVVYTLFTLSALFGLVGVIIKRVNFIRTFSGFLKGFLVSSIILAIVQLVFFFIDKDSNCTVGSDKHGTCVKSNGLSTGAVIAIVIVTMLIPILFQACTFFLPWSIHFNEILTWHLLSITDACWIISDCIEYLEDQYIGSRNVGMYPFSQPYAAVKPHEADLNHPYNKPYDSHA